MTQKEKDIKVAEFLTAVINETTHFIDEGIMDSFDVKFEYKSSNFQLALIKDGKVYGSDFKLELN